MRQIKANLETMKLPTEHCGVTGESSRHGSDDTARRPPSVKASLSVSFGQRAPHRASTRDSSPVRRTLPPPRERSHDGEGFDRDRGRDHDRDRDRDLVRDRDRQRRYDHDRRSSDRDSRDGDYRRYSERDNGRRDYERSARDGDRRRDPRSRRSRSRSRSRSVSDHRPSPFKDGNVDRAVAISSNLAKLKDLYGDARDKKVDAGNDRLRKDSSTEEVIRLGGCSWK